MDQCLAAGGLGGLRSRRKASAKRRQAARPRGDALYRAWRRVQRADGTAVRSERPWCRSSPARIRTARATPRHSRSLSRNGSAFRSTRSAIFRATREKVAIGRGTFAARSSMVGGVALALRSRRDHRQGRNRWRASCWRPPPTTSSSRTASFKVAGTDKAIPLTAVAKAFFAPAGPVAEIRAWPRGRGLLYRRTGRRAELSERLPGLRGRGRSGDRRRHDRPLRRRRRSRHDHQSDDLRGPDSGRHCAGPRPGAVRGDRLRSAERATPERELHGLRACRARRTCPTSYPR